MEKYYRFSGLEFAINIPEDYIYENERTLAAFAVNNVSEPHRFHFRLVDYLTPPSGRCIMKDGACRIYADGVCSIRYIGSVSESWETANMRVSHNGKLHDVELKISHYSGQIGVHTVLNALSAEHLIAQAGGFVFHCSYIDYNGRAILFTAPSGTGKSTQADLWNRYRGTQIINGDRAAVRIVDGCVMAEGIPFAGSSQFCENRHLPLGAIVYLDQASCSTIRRMRGYEAFARIWEGVSVNLWDRTDMELVSSAVQQVAQTIPVYHLPCRPDESAITVLEQALTKGGDIT